MHATLTVLYFLLAAPTKGWRKKKKKKRTGCFPFLRGKPSGLYDSNDMSMNHKEGRLLCLWRKYGMRGGRKARPPFSFRAISDRSVASRSIPRSFPPAKSYPASGDVRAFTRNMPGNDSSFARNGSEHRVKSSECRFNR